MTKAASSPILRVIRSVVEDQQVKELSEHELLARFITQHDETAFQTLLSRHGPMVLDVCRWMLSNEADAEDAFQATFLVFARKAKSVRKATSLGSWLYGVAYRTALKAQAEFAKRKRHERHIPQRAAAESPDDLTWREVREVLYGELNALPERYRVPLVLCYLQGQTQDQAAAQLGLPKGTLKGRLERARALLRERLVRRGLGPAAVLVASAWPAAVASAAVVPPRLLVSTGKAATAVATGKATAGLVSLKVAALTEGMLKAMFMTKLWTASFVSVVVVVLGLVAVGLSHRTLAVEKSDETRSESGSLAVKADESVRDKTNDKKQADKMSALPLILKAVPVARGQDLKPIECQGHESVVVSVAVSPDGTLVASGSDDQTLRFWKVADGKAIRTIKAIDPPIKGGWVGGLAFAPNGKTLVACPSEGGLQGLQCYNPATGKADPDRSPLRKGGYGVVFSPDGKSLAAANGEGVRVWDVAKGDQLHEFTFNRPIGRAWRVAFAPDGKHLAAALHRYGGREGERQGPLVRVWELATGKQVFATWEGGHANAVAFSPDGKLLAAGGENGGTVEVYDWAAKKQLARFQADAHGIFCLAFSADGKKLYTGGNDPEVKLWDVATGKAAGKLEGHTGQVMDLALSKDGTVLATAGDRRVLIWQLAAPPNEKPPKDKKAETKELITERKILRQRLEEIEKRLAELDLVGPFFVRMSEPYEVIQGEPHGLNVGLGNKATMRRDKFAYLVVYLDTTETKEKPVPVLSKANARAIFRTQPFRFEVEFPHADAKQPPLRVQGLTKPEDSDDGGNEMSGFVRVPKEARLGDVEIKVSWPAFQGVTQGGTTMKVFILPMK